MVKITTPTDFTTNVDINAWGRKTSCSFGFGDRFKNAIPKDRLNSPPPNTYTLKTAFDGENPAIKNNHLTTDFRQHSERRAFTHAFMPGDRMEREHEKLPGANQYNPKNNSIERNGSRMTTLRGKLEKTDFLSSCSSTKVPGPGHYKTIGIDAVGKYSSSKHP